MKPTLINRLGKDGTCKMWDTAILRLAQPILLPGLTHFKFGRSCLTRQARFTRPPASHGPTSRGLLLHHVPCPTAFGLMINSPKNAAPQRFQIGMEQES